MDHIICDTLISLLICNFLGVITKLRQIFYCGVRVLLKTLTHSSKQNGEIIDISYLKHNQRLNVLYYKDILC